MGATYDPTALVAGDFPLAHRSVTLAAGQNLKRGAVLGRITASGKYVLSVAGAGDGSQTPKAILAADTDATAADKRTPAYFTGEFAAEQLTYGAGHTAATVEAAFEAAGGALYLRTLGTAA